MPRKAGRAAQGSGTIRQRPDGRWEARATVGRDPGTGKQVQRSFYGNTQAEVRRKMQAVLTEVDNGSYIAPKKLTVGNWLPIWLEEYTGSIKQSSRLKYADDIHNHIIPALGAIQLNDLRPDTIQRFYNGMQRGDHPLSAKTIKNIHGVLHKALQQALMLDYIRSNPAERCTLPRIEKPEMHPLDAPDVKRLLDVLGDDVYSIIIKTALFTGMRQGELIGLQWSRVDFKRGEIYIDRQLTRPRHKDAAYSFSSLKNDKPRTVKPAPYVMQALKEHKKRQAAMRLLMGSVWDDEGFHDLVFTNDNGGHLYDATVLRHYKLALQRAGLPDNRFHDLRHTFAVNSLRAGDDVKTVQENLGHHTAAFTLDRYGHVTESMRDASAQRMQAFIDGLK